MVLGLQAEGGGEIVGDLAGDPVPQPATLRRQREHPDPSVVGIGDPVDESEALHPVHEPGDVRRVAGELLGKGTHRHRFVEEAEEAQLRTGEVVARRYRRHHFIGTSRDFEDPVDDLVQPWFGGRIHGPNSGRNQA